MDHPHTRAPVETRVADLVGLLAMAPPLPARPDVPQDAPACGEQEGVRRLAPTP